MSPQMVCGRPKKEQTDMDAKSKLVTISEAAAELGVSRRQIQRLIKVGRLQGAKLGRQAERYRYVTRNSLAAIVL